MITVTEILLVKLKRIWLHRGINIFTVFSLSPAAHLNAFELPRLGTKKTIYQWTGSRTLVQKFIQSRLGPMNFSIYKEHGANFQRPQAEIKSVSLKQSVLVYPRGSNSVGFFRETCKLQTMYLSANYSWWLLEACFRNTTADCIGRARKTQHSEVNNQKVYTTNDMRKRYRNITCCLTMGQLHTILKVLIASWFLKITLK